MEEEIIDDVEFRSGSRFAKTSFWLFILLLVWILLGTLIGYQFWDHPAIDFLYLVSGLLMVLLPIAGVIFGIKSVFASEESKWLKYIGLVGNILFLVTLIVLIVAIVVDVRSQ